MGRMEGYSCQGCTWTVSARNVKREEQVEAAIAHHAKTGHAVVAVPDLPEESTSGWAEQWPPDSGR